MRDSICTTERARQVFVGGLGIHLESVTRVSLGLSDRFCLDGAGLLGLFSLFGLFGLLLGFILCWLPLSQFSIRVGFLELIAKVEDVVVAGLMLAALPVIAPISLEGLIEVILLDALIHFFDDLFKLIQSLQ